MADFDDGLRNEKTTDSELLARLGKKQVLKRRFSFLALFGFAVCELITWETVLALFSQSFNNGGPAGAVYGFIIAWASTLSVYTVISELASLAPIAGGQYYWVYQLAPANWKKFTSYIVGWLTSLAWIATIATEGIFAGTILQGLLILDYPDYDDQRWQATLLSWAILLVTVFLNVVVPNILPKFQIAVLVLHIAGFIAVLATLLATAHPKKSGHFVFATALNTGGWSTQGLSFCVGFLGNVATFVGADASVHMAEEISNAALNVPRAITLSMCINGLVGIAMMITVLFCLGDVDSVLDTATGYPFIQIFYNATNSVAGATVMGAVVLILTIACTNGISMSASRMTWSFARDKGVPFSRVLSQIFTRNKVPVYAFVTCIVLAGLLMLIYIGSYTAFNDVVSLTITGFYGSYFLPAAFLLYHRIKGNVQPHSRAFEYDNAAYAGNGALEPTATATTTSAGPVSEKKGASLADRHGSVSQQISTSHGTVSVIQAELIWGPWHIPGVWGTINNAYACVYMVFVIFWSVWPPDTPVDASNMNYSIVVTGGVIILSIVWYHVKGKHEYQGPLIDEEVAAIMRLNVVPARE